MFDVILNFSLMLDGCPESGLDAVDFRVEHGLPPAPTDLVEVESSFQCESLCREFADLLDEDADLLLRYNPGYANRFPPALFPDEHAGGQRVYDAGLVSPGAAAAVVAAPTDPDAVRTLILDLRERADRARIALAEREREFQEERERDAEDRAEREAGFARLREWAATEGSELLRARVEEGFEWGELAEAEFGLAVANSLGYLIDPPVPDGCDEGDVDRLTTPTLDEIKALRAVRQRIADLDAPASATLHWVKYPRNHDKPVPRAEIRLLVKTPNRGECKHWILPCAVTTNSD